MSEFPHLERLIATIATLRGPEGCEWDREQDHLSLVRFLIEETYELVDAIEAGDREGLREELGDVLYQLLFHADIAGADPVDPFTIEDVAHVVDEKMRRRHPHVFGDVEVTGVEEIKQNWQALKAAEKPNRASVLDGVPRSLQGLARVREVLDRAARIGVEPEAWEAESFASERELGQHLVALVASAKAQGFDADRAVREALRDLESRVIEREHSVTDRPEGFSQG